MKTWAPVVAVLCVVVGACSGSRASTPSMTPPPVVAASAGTASVTIAAGNAAPVDVPGDLRSKVAPLVAARTFPPAGDDAGYGLDHPVATLIYRDTSGDIATVDLGGTTFDAHGVYARRRGSADISVVLADDVRPVLALVGVALPPPS